MQHTLFFSLCLSLLLVTCSGNHTGGNEPEKKTGNSDRQIKQLVFNSTDEQLGYRTNEFSINMLNIISHNEEEKSNICFSPLSCSMALGILMNGADGNTLSQMQDALGFEGVKQDDINAYYHKLLDVLPALDSTTVVNIANALWLRDAFPFNPDYKQKTKEVFLATIDNVESFLDQTTLDMINKWAADNTNELIKQILTPDMVTDETVMVFANALYFKGIWQQVFDKELTHKQPFTTLSGEEKEVDMMEMQEAYINYMQTADMKMIELDYKEGKYCMDLILPNNGTDIRTLLSSLTLDQWNEYLSRLTKNEAIVCLPKFKFAYNRDLKKDLQAAGIVDVFNENLADLSRLSDISCFLSFIKQYTFISVDEESTEAAAVTVGGVDCNSAMPSFSFVADHPFIFVIREKKYGTMLFTGIVGDPTDEQQ